MNSLLLASTPIVSGTIIDLIVIAILIIFLFIGVARGFAKTFISTFGTIISLICAFLLCSSVAVLIGEKFGLIETLSSSLSGVLESIFGAEIMNATIADASSASFDVSGISAWIVGKVLTLVQGDASIDPNLTLSQVISPLFAYYITVAISFIILFILFKILLFLIGKLVQKLWKINIIRRVDRLLGAVIGLLKGVIFVQLLVMLVGIIPIEFLQEINYAISLSSVTSFISSINLFSIILNNIGDLGFLKDYFATLSPA